MFDEDQFESESDCAVCYAAHDEEIHEATLAHPSVVLRTGHAPLRGRTSSSTRASVSVSVRSSAMPSAMFAEALLLIFGFALYVERSRESQLAESLHEARNAHRALARAGAPSRARPARRRAEGRHPCSAPKPPAARVPSERRDRIVGAVENQVRGVEVDAQIGAVHVADEGEQHVGALLPGFERERSGRVARRDRRRGGPCRARAM